MSQSMPESCRANVSIHISTPRSMSQLMSHLDPMLDDSMRHNPITQMMIKNPILHDPMLHDPVFDDAEPDDSLQNTP